MNCSWTPRRNTFVVQSCRDPKYSSTPKPGVRINFLRGRDRFIFGDRRTMNTVLKTVLEQVVLTFLVKILVGDGQNCATVHSNDLFFWRLSVHSAKFGPMHAAVETMAADNHVPQFPEERKREDNFWEIIAEIYILMFLRDRAHRSPSLCVRHCSEGIFITCSKAEQNAKF